MIPFAALHKLAAARGDGLRPEFARLFEEQARIAANPDILQMPRDFTEAGPVPVSALPESLPETVVIFTRPERERGEVSQLPAGTRRKKRTCTSQ